MQLIIPKSYDHFVIVVRKSYLTNSFVTVFHCTQNGEFSRDIILPNIGTPFFRLSKRIICS